MASAARNDFERRERFDKASRRFFVSVSIRMKGSHSSAVAPCVHLRTMDIRLGSPRSRARGCGRSTATSCGTGSGARWRLRGGSSRRNHEYHCIRDFRVIRAIRLFTCDYPLCCSYVRRSAPLLRVGFGRSRTRQVTRPASPRAQFLSLWAGISVRISWSRHPNTPSKQL